MIAYVYMLPQRTLFQLPRSPLALALMWLGESRGNELDHVMHPSRFKKFSAVNKLVVTTSVIVVNTVVTPQMEKSCSDKKNGGKILLMNFFILESKFFIKITLLQYQITFH